MRLNRDGDWDNECEDEQGTHETLEACAMTCQDLDECLQYSFNLDTKMCKTSAVPRLGQWREGTQSGWLSDRIEEWGEDQKLCKDEGFPS